jgi:hypothetical protein
LARNKVAAASTIRSRFAAAFSRLTLMVQFTGAVQQRAGQRRLTNHMTIVINKQGKMMGII